MRIRHVDDASVQNNSTVLSDPQVIRREGTQRGLATWHAYARSSNDRVGL